ncbi:YbjN domain-containing protein [Trinickia sp. NRRL B-1857]|uniref:YbjN domain-containing protein n=1 Tax=Trinickia sp. NRRL B-1857 TaxID=3162879 RepID=UPI003D2A590A
MNEQTTNAGGNAIEQDGWIEAIGIEELADLFRGAGYRVTAAEQNGIVQLMSASQGIGFAVRFGNVASAMLEQQAIGGVQPNAVRYLDYTLSCVMQVQGELPVELVASWNRTKRFARLASHGAFLALEMDVVVAGGVSARHLRSMIELWDRLIQEFLLHLRNRPAMAAQSTPSSTGADMPEGAAPAQGEASSAATLQ